MTMKNLMTWRLPVQTPVERWLAGQSRATRVLVVFVGMFLTLKAVGYVLWREPLDTHLVPTLLASLVFSWFLSRRAPARER